MREQSSKRWLGSFCLVNSIILIVSAIRFLSADGEYGAGWGAKIMSFLTIILAISFIYGTFAMFWPLRFKKFWRWWADS